MSTPSSDHRHEVNAPVEVVPYDPSWPEKFAAELGVLEEILKPWISGGIEHVGSTAVPGLDAKPVLLTIKSFSRCANFVIHFTLPPGG